MSAVPLQHALTLASILFSLGVLGVLVRRDMLFVLMSIEVMMNAAALAFVAAGSRWGQPDGQVMYIVILTFAGAEATVGLAMVLQLHRRFRTLDTDAAGEMKG